VPDGNARLVDGLAERLVLEPGRLLAATGDDQDLVGIERSERVVHVLGRVRVLARRVDLDLRLTHRRLRNALSRAIGLDTGVVLGARQPGELRDLGSGSDDPHLLSVLELVAELGLVGDGRGDHQHSLAGHGHELTGKKASGPGVYKIDISMLRTLILTALLAGAFTIGIAAAGVDADHPAAASPPPAPAPAPQPRPPDPVPRPPAANVLVGSFATNYEPGQPRVRNIKLAARMLDGTVLSPGETFSMNEALGERTIARGFVPAPSISGGRFVDSVGGGISQVATTLYNAAFFAGLDLVAHTPHSFYIDRYPIGREATISWGGPELVFRNQWEAPLRMRLRATATRLSVRFYSARLGRRVETETGTPYAYVQPVRIRVTNPSLGPGNERVVQEAGEPGFTVEYTRRVYRRGVLIRHERFRTRYEPRNAVVEVGPTAVGQP
jgi:VanW like protein/G5 domain